MELNGYIIAGGQSRRMGVDKATMLFDAVPFWKHVENAMIQITKTVKMVSSRTQHQQLDITIVNDTYASCGPLAGIYSALLDTDTPWNLICSCDVPMINQKVMQHIVAYIDDTKEAIIIKAKGQRMPLIGAYHKNCSSVFENHLNLKHLKMMDALEKLNVLVVDIPQEWNRYTDNINTINDLNTLKNAH